MKRIFTMLSLSILFIGAFAQSEQYFGFTQFQSGTKIGPANAQVDDCDAYASRNSHGFCGYKPMAYLLNPPLLLPIQHYQHREIKGKGLC